MFSVIRMGPGPLICCLSTTTAETDRVPVRRTRARRIMESMSSLEMKISIMVLVKQETRNLLTRDDEIKLQQFSNLEDGGHEERQLIERYVLLDFLRRQSSFIQAFIKADFWDQTRWNGT
ncbi:uncharacterized protein BT62DRAFT_924801 [Guyanagaster necrorhizus]|uniref:Uncharacterized protein n=1 Tax=Guyanagaster necrorhizus TaxID=856835 RepID=A0A9P7VEZ0_9AGAR|nr:uncharacterized protein BT62DRAFT_924801 [Guyanagaster necrorhizus MCA 3950]KAG7439315.1 hypothetical protein BT62DRAFT_924801 [Guyanagaster necrorhizus MCA 3950]